MPTSSSSSTPWLRSWTCLTASHESTGDLSVVNALDANDPFRGIEQTSRPGLHGTGRRVGNASAGDRADLASVPDQQRKGIEAIRETLKTVSRVIDTDRQQRIAQERLAHGQKKDKGISR